MGEYSTEYRSSHSITGVLQHRTWSGCDKEFWFLRFAQYIFTSFFWAISFRNQFFEKCEEAVPRLRADYRLEATSTDEFFRLFICPSFPNSSSSDFFRTGGTYHKVPPNTHTLMVLLSPKCRGIRLLRIPWFGNIISFKTENFSNNPATKSAGSPFYITSWQEKNHKY